MRAGCSGSACAGCSGPRPPRPLWAAARRAGSASTSRWPGARWTWPGSGVLEALPLRSVRALLGTWAGSVARAGPLWTGQRACHPGRCGRCGAAAWPLPGHRLRPLPPAPAGTPWPLALRPGLPDGHPPWGCVQRPVDREAEEYLVPHVHSTGLEWTRRAWDGQQRGWPGLPAHSFLIRRSPSSFCTCCGSPSTVLRRSRRRRPDFPDDLGNESCGRKVEPAGRVQGEKLLEQV